MSEERATYRCILSGGDMDGRVVPTEDLSNPIVFEPDLAPLADGLASQVSVYLPFVVNGEHLHDEHGRYRYKFAP